MDKKYSFKDEGNIYDYWRKNDLFKADRYHLQPYTVVIPPPNITGILHIGHALDTSLQDIVIRRKRMQGFNALYLPGTDHAGVATQAKVDERLKNVYNTDRFKIGREEFFKHAFLWKDEHIDIIRNQWKLLGLSLDYSRECFTMDENLSKLVTQRFIDLYNKGLIYRDYKIINWDTQARTALSNIEVEHEEKMSKLYYIRYDFVESNLEQKGLIIATTRPETCFADQALMVNPSDKRYQKFIGKEVYIPTTNTKIKVIQDSYVDKDFGSGVVKVTPAHDPNDFEVGKRHGLNMPLCMNEDGTMNELSGKYNKLDRFECREQLINDLKESGHLIEIKDHLNSIGYSERTKTMVEPRLSLQWFLRMDYFSNLARNTKVKFYPKRMKKIFINWMTDTLDWCISRQVWWGHRIPAWYKDNQVLVQETKPGDGWVQDEDVLDTWFSSGLWPFTSLGYPNSSDYQTFFPTNSLITGTDLIFFWVARMIFQSIDATGKDPFEEVVLHGLVRDSQGRKMSKSLQNGIDPTEVIEKYGTDALRYFLITSSSPGQNFKYDEQKIEASWNYLNKLWNISRYVLGLGQDYNYDFSNFKQITLADKWIIQELSKTIKNYDKYLDKYEFVEAYKLLYNFIWNDFSSYYLEISKVYIKNDLYKENTIKVLLFVLDSILRLLHPSVPFITEKINLIYSNESIIRKSWPKALRKNSYVLHKFEIIKDILTKVRNYKANFEIVKEKLEIVIDIKDEKVFKLLKENELVYKDLLNLEKVEFVQNFKKDNYDLIVFNGFNLYILKLEKEKDNSLLEKQLKELEKELERSRNILSNPNFLQKANPEKIELEKQKQRNYEEKYNEVLIALGKK